MNALNRRITLSFVIVSLIVVGTLQAQNAVSDPEVQQALAVKQAEATQKQAQAVQKQSQAVERQIEAEQRQVKLAAMFAQNQATEETVPVPPTPPGPAQVNVSVPSISFRGTWPSRSGSASVLVIPTAELKVEELVTTTEDMTVMSRIFEKNLEQAHIATARGSLFVSSADALSVLLGGGGGAIQSMYLEGYGALFLMRVDFPLSEPPQVKEEEQPEKKEQGDPVWEQMRRDMYEPQEADRHEAKEPQQKYDAEKVESLKTTLVKALKHAANIRSLKQEESVILVVAGSGVSAGETAMVTTSSEIVVKGRRRIVQQQPERGGSSQTVLIVRAKKSDIDSFAKSGDYEQFRQRTQLLSCPCLGAEAGRGDPFGGRYFY